jgi:putative PIN family toxin of toxin-antitoxin system
VIRAVLDTNAVVSALIFKASAFPLVTAWQQQRFRLLVSPALLEDCIRVFHYPKFRLSEGEIKRLLYHEMVPFITPVKVSRTPRVILADPSDDHILACAVAGNADIIVSGDRHLLDLGQYRAIPIVPIADFLARV